jgi:hypothetical protein
VPGPRFCIGGSRLCRGGRVLTPACASREPRPHRNRPRRRRRQRPTSRRRRPADDRRGRRRDARRCRAPCRRANGEGRTRARTRIPRPARRARCARHVTTTSTAHGRTAEGLPSRTPRGSVREGRPPDANEASAPSGIQGSRSLVAWDDLGRSQNSRCRDARSLAGATLPSSLIGRARAWLLPRYVGGSAATELASARDEREVCASAQSLDEPHSHSSKGSTPRARFSSSSEAVASSCSLTPRWCLGSAIHRPADRRRRRAVPAGERVSRHRELRDRPQSSVAVARGSSCDVPDSAALVAEQESRSRLPLLVRGDSLIGAGGASPTGSDPFLVEAAAASPRRAVHP